MSQADDRKFTVDEGEAARNQENLQQEYLSLSQQQAALDQDIARLAQEAELPQPDSAADLEDLEDALDRDIQDLQKWQALRQATEEQEATVKRCDGLD